MTTPNPTPEVGQVWADNDERTKGAGEFTIISVHPGPLSSGYVWVRRGEATRRIRLDRLADTGSRGYRFIGRAK